MALGLYPGKERQSLKRGYTCNKLKIKLHKYNDRLKWTAGNIICENPAFRIKATMYREQKQIV